MTTATVDTVVSYTTPLDDVTVQTMTTELAALEQCPVHGWDAKYPTLYNTLRAITQEFCTTLNCTVPGIVITFQGIQRHQASAYLMTDGTTQLHIGAGLIRATLLNATAPDREVAHRAFRWTIAHELGHLVDPAFNRFGRSYQFRVALDKIATTLFFVGLLSWILNTSIFLNGGSFKLQLLSNTNCLMIFVASTVLMALKALVITLLHRRFEYTADATAARLMSDSNQQAMTLALTTMVTAIRTSITNPYAQAAWPMLRMYGWCYQRGTTAKLFLLHPSMEHRVKRVQASR